jgi:sensor histidine kinase YesM
MVTHKGKMAFGRYWAYFVDKKYLIATCKNWIMLIRAIIMWWWFLGVATSSMGQQKKLDSLLNELEKNKDKATTLQKIITQCKRDNEITYAINYSHQLIEFSKTNKDENGTLFAYTTLASIYSNTRKNDSAFAYAKLAQSKINKLSSPRLEAQILGDLAKTFYQTGQLDSCFPYLTKAIAINQKILNDEELVENYIILSRYLGNRKNDFTQAEAIAEKAYSIVKTTSNKEAEVKVLMLLAAINIHFGKSTKSIDYALKALDIATKNKINKELYSIYAILGSNYIDVEDYDQALNFLNKSELALSNFNGPKNNLGRLYGTYAALYKAKNNYPTAILYHNKQLAFAENLGDKTSSLATLIPLTDCYLEVKNYDTAIQICKRSINLAIEISDSNRLGLAYSALGRVYRDAPEITLAKLHIDTLNRYQLAIEKFKEALAISEQASYLQLQSEIWQDLSKSYELQKDYINAYDAYKKFIKIQNSILNNEEKNKINKLQIQYDYTKKEDSLKLIQANTDATLLKQQFLNKEQAQNLLLQNNEILLNKQTILNSNQQLAILNKDKELQHLAFLKTQADLQTEQLQNSEKEKELTLVQKEKLLQTSQVKSLSQENELNKLKQRQLLFYGIAGLASLLFAGLYLFNRNKAKQAQLKVELEKKEAEFQRSLADVSMSALRSQMNPHFIFNCLNSIKLYTTQNDTVAASNYLTKFSKLIRMALENSRSETVTLDAELESLELYIQMEAMRFKEKLKYSIAIDKNVDSSFIEIPPMLLQPYVENAIWHGLMHREDGGRIDVGVRVIPNESTLAITIKDNGVGREKAAQLKSKTATSHKSYGTKVTGERLDLINQIYKTGASVTTEDLTSNGEVTGTLVTIKIPFE